MIAHDEVAGSIKVDFGEALNVQTLYQSIPPVSTSTTIVGISIPAVNINCLQFPTIDPVKDIKDAMTKLYNYAMKIWIEPIWTMLSKLWDALKSFGLGELDLSLGILDLHISDLFDDANQFYDKILAYVSKALRDSYDELVSLLKKLEIPYPLFGGLTAPDVDVVYIVKAICHSIWGVLLKKIWEVIGFLSNAWYAYDLATSPPGTYPWSRLWNDFKNAILASIAIRLITPPTMQEILDALILFAKTVLNKIVVTAEDLLSVIKDFSFGIFGKPFDWLFPLNPTVSAPNIDIGQILTDILAWCSNFLFLIIYKFNQACVALFELFGIAGNFLTSLEFPITLCVVKNPGLPDVPAVPVP
jgi:hypothetical protein